MDQYQIFVILAPISLLVSIGTGLYAWRFRHKPLGRSLALMMIPVCGYLITNTLELVDPTESGTLFWGKAGYLFAPSLAVLWLAFALDYTGRQAWLAPRRLWMLFIVPTLTLSLVLTNEWHHLIWTSTRFIPRSGFLYLSVSYGPWFWVNTIYSYALLLLGTFLVVREYILYFKSYRSQSIWVLIGMVIPLAAHAVYVYRLFPAWQKDYSPIGFAFTGLALTIGIFRYQLISLAPIARSLVMDYIQDGLCVLDHQERVIDANPAFLAITSQTIADLVGRPAAEALPFWNELNVPQNTPLWQSTLDLKQEGEIFSYEVRVIEIARSRKTALGRLLALHDYTERKRLMAVVEQLAITDPLTGLYNRRYFSQRAQEELERSARLRHPLSLLMLDLDHFKRVNDTHGHSTGDQVLAHFAGILQTMTRGTDITARFGGEEFIVLLPETGPQEACATAERIRHAVETTPCPCGQLNIPITTSIGLATAPAGQRPSLENLSQQADLALYAAKHSGRNRVAAFSEGGEAPRN
ncbi:MAG TPA: histidine kinase N-terminal 7TM domain-containing protein [Anaerolineaceae bacterium]|nr:histidine kinase N-terminal 7TM domain-containing protein [Anaerolineaceae bacterium]HPN53404.1 histidine kinase N-terminal 7TM domain-containing protein [Anaerolineaceae bacterium]